MKKLFTFFTLLVCFFCTGLLEHVRGQAPATLPYTQNFTTANDFTFVNGTQVNKWVYGTAAGNPGGSIYVSNDNGVTNNYTNTSSSVVHAYREFTVPAGTTMATLVFDWRSFGGDSTFDRMRVYLAPSTFTPTAGTQMAATGGNIQLGANFEMQNTWQNYTNPTVNLTSFAGSTVRLIFEWRNDGIIGTSPASAVDNINFFIPTCVVPSAQAVTGVVSNGATLSWTSPTPAPANGFAYYITTTNVPPVAGTPPTGTTTTPSVNLVPTLTPNTQYFWWVKSVCSSTDSSLWMPGPTFTTTQIPASLPYTQAFSGSNDFGFTTGTQVNKWYHGAAAGNPVNGIYISNDNGVTNAYTTSPPSTQVTHAYRDFTIPAGTTAASPAILSFDWRAIGEGTTDYLRVWVVPAGFMPVAGTQITTGTDRVQLTQLNQQGTWQNYLNPTLNVSAYAGAVMRLVFEWRNDTFGGSQPPAAIDNVNLLIPTCKVPTALNVTGLVANGATIGWTAPTPAPANGYAYYISTTNVPPMGAPTGTTTGTTVNLTPTLTPNTTYYWWVRAICSSTDSSIWVPGPSFTTTQIPATLPYSQNFNTNDFGFVNGTQVNKWYYGSVVGNPANAIYISDNGGVTNTYTTSTSTNQVAHAYRDFAIPAGTTAASPAILTFDWRAFGEGTTWDYLRVWMVPASYMPVAGTQIAAGTNIVQIGQFNQQSTWQNYINTNVNLAAYAGATMRLVFEWRSDTTGGTQPPAAVDNINLLIPTCKVPTALAVAGVVSNGATISWTAPTPAPALGYAYYISTSNVPPTGAPTGTTTATSVNLAPTLVPNTTYYWWVRAVCSSTDSSIWIPGPSFTTTQIPAVLPYLQNFETANDLGLLNGTQTNKWFYGSATGNTGKSIYISDNGGVTNTYAVSTSSNQVVHAYRDIAIPAGTSLAIFSFDWKAEGESSFDYLRVWLVPSNFMPTPGTQIVAGTGRVQVGQYNLNGTTWQTYSNASLNLSSFAGVTMRLVFEWRNDTILGAQPPAAVDNINLRVCSTATPSPVTVTTITHNSAQVVWPQDTGGASYKLRYRPVGSTQWLPSVTGQDIPTVTSPNQSIPLSGLIPATLYEVEVAAVCNTINVGNFSHTEFTTKCDPTPPNVTFTNITSTSAVVNWSPLAASATYQMQWRKVGDIGWITVTLPNPPANTYALPSPGYTLTPYTQYEVQIRNICVGSTTPNPWSSLSRFTTERTCEIPPPGLTILELKPTSAKVQWDPYVGPDATGKYILRYRKVGIPGWTNVPVTTNLYTLTGLTELTKYEMQVANVCSGTPGNYTLPYYFTTPTVIYCQMGATTGSGDYISKVTVVPTGKPQMIKDSGVSNYTDYTADPLAQIEMIQGSVNNQLTVDKVVTGDAGVVAWIDFDRNGEFDINERILVSGPNADATATATFSVPSDAFVSNVDYMYVVMRVALMKGGLPVNCTNFDKGEVEDYTVRITKKAAANVLNQTDILIYPNPVSTVLNVTNISKRANFKIYNAAGQLVTKGIILNNKVDVRSLINGVYMIDIEDGSTSVQKKFIKE
ncbi:fibronectin type III domain-containing protein [Chryseobacterium gwangjuense]|uniref:fibronectin type III domain-containing protein n=1 Tax=Chryseobacterium gwangjuense TaxID=1069980 RepID=UPI001E2C14A4|nr:fibronectin type III domain-containing protein [Chryseobacterium gwangjuense]MCE3077293.1 fibronectin type III domain-containing protein [Chryseobacterium gwangjuense]